MEKQIEKQTGEVNTKATIVPKRIREEVEIVILGSRGCAPTKERQPLPSTVRLTLAYAGLSR